MKKKIVAIILLGGLLGVGVGLNSNEGENNSASKTLEARMLEDFPKIEGYTVIGVTPDKQPIYVNSDKVVEEQQEELTPIEEAVQQPVITKPVMVEEIKPVETEQIDEESKG